MKTNKNNLVLSFIVVIIAFGLQLCFYENKVYALSMTVSNYTPADDDLGVAVNNNLTLTFNRAWRVTGNAGSIQIKELGTNNVFETYNFPAYPANITGEHTNTLTIDPTGNFSLDDYYVTITNDIIYSDDMDELHYAGINDDMTWNFTTAGCYNPPTCIGPCIAEDPEILHKSPPDGGHFMQSYEGINMILDQVVTVGVGNIVIRKYSDDSAVETIDITSNQVIGWGTTSITINPSVNLADNTHYYINLDLTDYATVADKDKWDFWTKATPNTFSGSGL